MRVVLRLAGPGVVVSALFISVASFGQDQRFLARNDTFVANDPLRGQLLAAGKPGATIALARERVAGILQSQNSCSSWFKEIDPDAAAIFASLKFVIDANGPQNVVSLRSESGEMLFKQPYSAKAWEYGGGSSVVILNANGAFFVRTAFVLRQENAGSSLYRSGWRYLRVGSYAGDTLAAQMAILLHELGHVVGRLPDDSDEWSGQSGRNTTELLRFCHNQINAAARIPPHPTP